MLMRLCLQLLRRKAEVGKQRISFGPFRLTIFKKIAISLKTRGTNIFLSVAEFLKGEPNIFTESQ